MIHSTFRSVLHGDSIPAKLSSVETFVRVLGGTTEDPRRWATAWRRIVMNDPAGQETSDDGTAEHARTAGR